MTKPKSQDPQAHLQANRVRSVNLLQPQGTPNTSMAGEGESSRVGGGQAAAGGGKVVCGGDLTQFFYSGAL